MTSDRPADARPSASPTVSRLHRTITVLAVISLFVGTRDSWTAAIWSYPRTASMIMIGYGLMLVCGVLALSARSPRAMVGIDVAVTAVALMVRLPAFLTSYAPGYASYGNDEGQLVDYAGTTLAHGHNPYTEVWTDAYARGQGGITLTMDGRIIDRFDYPPISALLNALAKPFSFGVPTAALVSTLGLVAAMVVMFAMVPAPWRAAAPLVCLGLNLLPPIARAGYPAMVALPFLVVAVASWTRVGIGRAGPGRLGVRGWAGAICLGLAISTQQLAWFLAPFLVVGILVLRGGDLGARRGCLLIARYVGVVIGVVAAVNGPFLVMNARAWWTGILLPMTEPTVPHGQGLVGISYYLIGGSGALNYYAYATMLLAAALLLCFVLFIERLGPAMVILPWLVFYLSVRSQDDYFLSMTPIWIVSIATVGHADFVRAWRFRPRLRRWRPLQHWAGQTIAAVILLIPAAMCVRVAILTPPPLRMNVVSMIVSRSGYLINVLEVDVTNVSGRTIEPHFTLSDSESMSHFLVADTGPETLTPRQTALYVLVPWSPGSRRSLNDRVMLRAVTTDPVTLSSLQLNFPEQPSAAGAGTPPRRAP